MKNLLTFIVIVLAFVLAACESTDVMPSGRDELGRLVDTQTQATIAAAKLRGQQVEATTRADATREYLALSGQQTRVAQQAVQTQTAFAQNVTATAIARSATQTRAAEDSRATATAQAAQATATVQAAEFTATAHAQSVNATATAQTQNVSATATTQAVIVEQTRVAASATATSNAASAQQTQVAAAAIQTRTAEETQTIAAKADWERKTEMVRAFASAVGIALLIVGGLIVVGFLALKVADAIDLRIRTGRGASGEPFIAHKKPDGTWQIMLPMRSPGAVFEINPEGRLPSGVTTGAVDADVTRRDQAVSLMLASNANAGDAAGVLDDEPSDDANAPGIPNINIFKPFEARPLALDKQPSRLALPIGVTERGAEMWISLNEVTHALVGGPTGMGKSLFLHGWIQALARGGQVYLTLADGKAGMEFGRYANTERTQVLRDGNALVPMLSDALVEMRRRFELMTAAGATNLGEYNLGRDTDRLSRQVIVIDELFDALTYDGVEPALAEIARKGRAAGIQLVMSAQLSDAESVPRQLRANTTLRIAFACVSHSDSHSILGRAGAEKIEKTPGRLLVFWRGEIVQAQAFRAALPPALPGGNVGTLPPPSPLDDDTRKIIEFATREGGGWFVVARIARALGLRKQDVSRVAMNLERMGLLSSVQKDEGGQNIGRKLMPKFESLSGTMAE